MYPPNKNRVSEDGLEVQVSTDDQFGSHIHDHPNPDEHREAIGFRGYNDSYWPVDIYVVIKYL